MLLLTTVHAKKHYCFSYLKKVDLTFFVNLSWIRNKQCYRHAVSQTLLGRLDVKRYPFSKSIRGNRLTLDVLQATIGDQT